MAAKPLISKGVPEIGFPPLDPLYFPVLDYSIDNGALNFTLYAQNVSIFGIKSMKISEVSSDLRDESKMTIKFTALLVPRMSIEAKYALKGQILVLPVFGVGDLYANFTSIRLETTLKFHSEVGPDGQKHLKADAVKLNMPTKNGKVNVENLFNGNKRLGLHANRFFNSNFLFLWNAVRFLPEKSFSEYFINATNTLFDHYTADELLPE